MDILPQKNFLQCQNHQQFNLELMKINNLEINSNHSLFYCYQCLEEDESFSQKNCLLISKIIGSGDSCIIPKWPPIKDQKILENLSQLLSSNNGESLEEMIDNSFEEFKKEIISKIFDHKKRLIKLALDIPNKDSILADYQRISKICELRNILIDNNTELQQKEGKCKQIIEEMDKLRDKNNDLLKQLLDNHSSEINQMAMNLIKSIQQSIFTQIDQFNLIVFDKIQLNKLILQNQDQLLKGNQIFINENLQSNSQSILKDISFSQTQYCKNENTILFNKNENNQITIQNKICGNKYVQCVLNNKLEMGKEYIFRFNLNQTQISKNFHIGLASRNILDDENGTYEGLCCRFTNKTANTQEISDTKGIDTYTKGNKLIIQSDQQQLEMRVDLKNSLLQLTDYPNYSTIITADPARLMKPLIQNKDLSLFILIQGNYLKITLTEALVNISN